ncbi:MAG: cytochrome c [Brevundimonas sp.]|uniref:c-type cytochrome n=1 Tax=Brevundimonas sp. TaxID=1871086 RepID=UPI002488E13D|nr:cytochrome c [Brevundimonas sp.]MDI1327914.1 cytochrome c [Brevundimonas sp.]
MRKWVTAAVLGLLCVGGAANARGEGEAAIIQGRQGAMMLSGVAMGAMKSAIDTGQAPSTQRFSTRALARWAHAVPGMFPAGTGPEAGVPTRAKPEVWSDRAGFEARAADYAAAADRLAELAGGEDAAAFSAQWSVVRQSCNTCHTAYKLD